MIAEPTILELRVESENPPASGDFDLVSRARSGDVHSFERLYRGNVGRVYAVCLRIVRDAGRAEELTQDAFVRAWEMLGSFRGESAFSTWLHRIAVNIVLSDMRSRRRTTAHTEPSEEIEKYDAPEAATAHGTRLDLEGAIASLPPQARAIFTLHDIEGFKHHEIAREMGLAVGTSKTQLHRARKLLKKVLK